MAHALPIPRAAPVTNATFPASMGESTFPHFKIYFAFGPIFCGNYAIELKEGPPVPIRRFSLPPFTSPLYSLAFFVKKCCFFAKNYHYLPRFPRINFPRYGVKPAGKPISHHPCAHFYPFSGLFLVVLN